MKSLMLLFGLLLSVAVFCDVVVVGAEFKVGDLVYICNEDFNDSTPLCITNYASKILEVRRVKDSVNYEYRVKVYASEPGEKVGWNVKWWIKEKYIHKW